MADIFKHYQEIDSDLRDFMTELENICVQMERKTETNLLSDLERVRAERNMLRARCASMDREIKLFRFVIGKMAHKLGMDLDDLPFAEMIREAGEQSEGQDVLNLKRSGDV